MKLLAPNGKPSNLTPEQYKLVRSDAFISWFGDWLNSPETASKVVDKNGEPLVCYHGTKKYDRFYKFRKGSKGYLGGGIYFTSNKEKAKDYSRYGTYYGNLYEVFLDIKDPFNVTGSIGTDDFLNKIYGSQSVYKKRSDKQSFDTMIVKSSDIKKLLDKGYDGIYWDLADEFVVYSSNQIKLADGTNTTFDYNNPDIRYEGGGGISNIDQYTSKKIKKAYVSIRIKYESGRAENDMFYNNYEIKSFDEKTFEELKDHKLKGILGVSTSNYNLSEWLVHRECLVVMPFDKFLELNKTEQVQYYDADYLTKNGLDALYRLYDRKDRSDQDYYSILQNIFPKISNEFNLEGMVKKGTDYTNMYVVSDLFNVYNSGNFIRHVSKQERINSPYDLAKIVIDYTNSEQIKNDYPYNRSVENLTIESIINPITKGIINSGRIYVDESEWLIKDSELVIPENSQLFFVLKGYDNMRSKYDEMISKYDLKSSYKIGFISQKNLNELQSKRFNLKDEKWKAEYQNARTQTEKRILKTLQSIQNEIIEKWTNQIIEDFRVSDGYENYKDYDGNQYGNNILEVPDAITYFDSLMLRFIDIYNARIDNIVETKSKYAFVDIKNDFTRYLEDLKDKEGNDELGVKTEWHHIYKEDLLRKLLYGIRVGDYYFDLDNIGERIKSEVGSDLYRYFSKDEISFKKGGVVTDELAKIKESYDFGFEYFEGEIYGQDYKIRMNKNHPRNAYRNDDQFIHNLSLINVEYPSAVVFREENNKVQIQKDKIYSWEDAESEIREFFYEIEDRSNQYKKGGSLSKTPAPKKERIYGSKVNKPKSSASKSKASSIILSPKVITSINTILEKHNEKSNKKIPLATAKAVVRRGMGAYSSTHRPTISGGKPNSRVAWGLARLNAFVFKIQKGYSKSGKYIQDDDLINELGYRVKKYENGGNVNSNKFMMWFIEWYKPISDKMNITFSLPNIIAPFKEENVIIMDLFEKIDQNIDAKEYLKDITNKADEYDVIIYLEPMPRYKYFLKNIEKRKKISKEYLISYYKKFGFELTPDGNFMKRLPKLEKGNIIGYETIKLNELEKLLGRKINIFNENIVNVNGVLYQKVFLKLEYKRISF